MLKWNSCFKLSPSFYFGHHTDHPQHWMPGSALWIWKLVSTFTFIVSQLSYHLINLYILPCIPKVANYRKFKLICFLLQHIKQTELKWSWLWCALGKRVTAYLNRGKKALLIVWVRWSAWASLVELHHHTFIIQLSLTRLNKTKSLPKRN